MPALGGAGPNWEQFRSAQVPKVCGIGRGDQLGAIGPIGLRPALSVYSVFAQLFAIHLNIILRTITQNLIEISVTTNKGNIIQGHRNRGRGRGAFVA